MKTTPEMFGILKPKQIPPQRICVKKKEPEVRDSDQHVLLPAGLKIGRWARHGRIGESFDVLGAL